MLSDYFDMNVTRGFISHQAPLFRSFQGFSQQLGILSEDYFSFLNPMFAICIDDLAVLAPYKIVSFRDGFLGLGCFFSRFPVPAKKFQTLIGIPASLASVVPKSWKEHVYFYQFHLKKKGPCHSLIFCSFPDRDYGFGQERLSQDLQSLIQQHQFQDISCLDFDVPHFYSQEKVETLHYNYRSVSLDVLLARFDLTGHFIHLNAAPFVVYDHYLIHAFMSKNALVTTPLTSLFADESYDLSLFHRVDVSYRAPADFGDLFKGFLKIWNNSSDLFFKDPKHLDRYREFFEKEFILEK